MAYYPALITGIYPLDMLIRTTDLFSSAPE